MGTFVCSFFRPSKMPPSPAETPENETNPQTQDQLSLNPWEAAYLRFESPEEEIRKFIRRLTRLGAPQWRRDAEIVELFCGRGNGLIALQRLGFTRLEGVDLSPRLLAQFKGSAKCTVADCRRLPFADRSKVVLIVQGGLHHLPSLPDLRALSFRNLSGPPHFQQDGRVRYHDRVRTPHLRAMAGPARTHQENCPDSFSTGARIVRLGQMELRRHSKIDIDGA